MYTNIPLYCSPHLISLVQRDSVDREAGKDRPVRESGLVALQHRREHLIGCHRRLQNHDVRLGYTFLANRGRRRTQGPAGMRRSWPIRHPHRDLPTTPLLLSPSPSDAPPPSLYSGFIPLVQSCLPPTLLVLVRVFASLLGCLMNRNSVQEHSQMKTTDITYRDGSMK